MSYLFNCFFSFNSNCVSPYSAMFVSTIENSCSSKSDYSLSPQNWQIKLVVSVLPCFHLVYKIKFHYHNQVSEIPITSFLKWLMQHLTCIVQDHNLILFSSYINQSNTWPSIAYSEDDKRTLTSDYIINIRKLVMYYEL